jgi:hypothetical protein
MVWSWFFPVIFAYLAHATGAPASANTLNGRDEQTVGDLVNRSHRLAEDVYHGISTEGDKLITECRRQIFQELTLRNSALFSERLVVGLASEMKDPIDEIHVLYYSLITNNGLIETADHVRAHTNEMFGLCSYDAFIVTKSRQIFNLLDDLDRFLGSIDRRIRAGLPPELR